MPTQKTITVTAADADKRLDVFLASQLPGMTRSKIQNYIREGRILLNGKEAKPHAFLRENDVVTMATGDSKPEKKAKTLESSGRELNVVFEDDDLAVINKPSGLLVHPTVQNEKDTLAHALVGYWPKIAKVGDAPDQRPGIVHRLDKDASGLLVVAKTKKAFEALKEQFQTHSIEKEYAVLVNGRPPKDSATITPSIGRAASGTRMAARAEAEEGDKPTVTHYRIEELFRDAALLSVRTETGRTHQIRASFQSLGCPVVGDTLYHVRKGPSVPAPHLFLHAKRLAFTHPTTGQRMEFTAPLPAELETTLRKLRT